MLIELLCRLSGHVPLSKPIVLGATDSVKIILTATENGKPKRPHQAFLLLKDEDTGLETTFPFSMKENGKGKVDFVCFRSPLEIHTMLISPSHRRTFQYNYSHLLSHYRRLYFSHHSVPPNPLATMSSTSTLNSTQTFLNQNMRSH